MGMFLSMAAVDSGVDDVGKALEAIEEEGSIEEFSMPGGMECPDDRILLMFDDYCSCGTEVCKELSRRLGKAVFHLHIHDGDLWMYELFVNGKDMDRFNTMPGYWEDISDEERDRWKGNASVICANWSGVNPSDIEKYLVFYAEGQDSETKAYETDEFPQWDCWQVTDFMAKLGVPYPNEDEGDWEEEE